MTQASFSKTFFLEKKVTKNPDSYRDALRTRTARLFANRKALCSNSTLTSLQEKNSPSAQTAFLATFRQLEFSRQIKKAHFCVCCRVNLAFGKIKTHIYRNFFEADMLCELTRIGSFIVPKNEDQTLIVQPSLLGLSFNRKRLARWARARPPGFTFGCLGEWIRKSEINAVYSCKIFRPFYFTGFGYRYLADRKVLKEKKQTFQPAFI